LSTEAMAIIFRIIAIASLFSNFKKSLLSAQSDKPDKPAIFVAEKRIGN
jgi:hypothetical protein